MELPHRRQFLHLAARAVALPSVSRIAWAQTYPSRPVRVIVPFGPGGSTDTLARLISQRLSEHLGKQFYVENLAGAGGNIGTGQAARASPDGHTILVALSSFVVNPSLFTKISYDPIKDFDPVTLAVTSTTALLVNAAVPASSVVELIALIRANPGKYSYAFGGVGTTPHLVGEQFRLAFGLDLVGVPFNGGAAAVGAVIAGHTPIGFLITGGAISQIKQSTLRALAVTSRARAQALPDVPTFAEAGYPNVKGDNWLGVLVPAGTPQDVVALLQREINDSINNPDIRERLEAMGLEIVGSTPEEFSTQIKYEIGTWRSLIQAAGIKAE